MSQVTTRCGRQERTRGFQLLEQASARLVIEQRRAWRVRRQRLLNKLAEMSMSIHVTGDERTRRRGQQLLGRCACSG